MNCSLCFIEVPATHYCNTCQDYFCEGHAQLHSVTFEVRLITIEEKEHIDKEKQDKQNAKENSGS